MLPHRKAPEFSYRSDVGVDLAKPGAIDDAIEDY
jgi:hypothetical protein